VEKTQAKLLEAIYAAPADDGPRLVYADFLLEQGKPLGARLNEFDPREVRRLLVGNYELRYELTEEDLFVLRIWHLREAR
jgi:uncharacterized protein (TIGR02996 family)